MVGLEASGRSLENPWWWVGRGTLGQNRDRQMPGITLSLCHYASLAISSPFEETPCQEHLSWWWVLLHNHLKPSSNRGTNPPWLNWGNAGHKLKKTNLKRPRSEGRTIERPTITALLLLIKCFGSKKRSRAEECKWFRTYIHPKDHYFNLDKIPHQN